MAISGLAMTGSVATAGEVGALGCTATGADKDATAYNKAFTTTVNIRSGRSTNCVSLGVGYTSHTVDIHCTSTYNGEDWTYLRNVNTGVKGWVKTSLLDWPNHRLVMC
ncbi:SH3 domain-containing protein [Stackebrandtia soli]|uniref:SH3 domain-containing protein n=1 Tax=Stackebrandtia soli TaxID=1892856 RepID=UPI0039E791EE